MPVEPRNVVLVPRERDQNQEDKQKPDGIDGDQHLETSLQLENTTGGEETSENEPVWQQLAKENGGCNR